MKYLKQGHKQIKRYLKTLKFSTIDSECIVQTITFHPLSMKKKYYLE